MLSSGLSAEDESLLDDIPMDGSRKSSTGQSWGDLVGDLDGCSEGGRRELPQDCPVEDFRLPSIGMSSNKLSSSADRPEDSITVDLKIA